MNNRQLIQGKETIEFLLGMTEEFHNEMIYDIGIQWLNIRWEYNPTTRFEYESTADFWNWWKLLWNQRNVELLYQMGFDLDERCAINELEQEALCDAWHNAHKGTNKLYPSKPIHERIKANKKVLA